MLNELHLLERGLAEHGMKAVARHPDLSQLLKGDAIRVRLDANGAIDSLELLPGKTRPEIWTLRDGKHNGFPGLKTARSFLVLDAEARATHDAAWKAAAKSAVAKRAEIERLLKSAPVDPDLGAWPKPGHRARIAERQRHLQTLAKHPETAAVPATFARFLKALDRDPHFLAELLQKLIERTHSHDEWLDVIRTALVAAVSLAVDVVVDGEEFRRAAGDAGQVEAVTRALAGTGNGKDNQQDGVCALTGSTTRLLEGSFPQPTLPSLGQTYLFSRNSDIPALARYGRNGPDSFPVDADLVSRFSGALGAITAEERHGMTWRRLPTEAGDGQDLLIAFVASEINEPFANGLAADDDSEEQSEAESALEQYGTDLIGFWQGISTRAAPDETARIMILRTVDPGNRKAVYDKRSTVKALCDAARQWTTAMANAPEWIAWPIFVKRKQIMGRPKQQSPLSLIQLSRKLYIRGGREAAKAPGVSSAEALALFFDEGNRERRAERVLHLLLDRHTNLLAGITHANRRGLLKDFDPKATARVDALRSISWIGALLFFLGRTREDYMEDAAFKLGQFLSAADVVHMGYCADRRGGDLPPVLVGNSVFSSAGRNPVKALAILQQRMSPYLVWGERGAEARQQADTISDTNSDEGKVRPWTPRSPSVRRSRIYEGLRAFERWRELLPEVRAKIPASTPTDAFRAQLLLGYIAGLKQESKSENSDSKEEGIAA